MAKSKLIKTGRLIIEPFSEKYLTERYISWLNDPEIVKYSEQRHKKHTFESCQQYMKSFNGTLHYFWAIISRDKQLGHIGNINAYVDPINLIADIGILIGERSVWGLGYGYESWIAVCGYLFEKVGLRKITAGTLSVNSRMLSLMNKAGMVKDGKRNRHYLFEGAEVDLIYMALFKNDWNKVKGKQKGLIIDSSLNNRRLTGLNG